MTKPGKTPKKKTKEKSPQRTEESEYPAMDEETYNRLLRNAIEHSKAELEAKLQQQHKEQLKEVEERLTKKFDDEVRELSQAFDESRGAKVHNAAVVARSLRQPQTNLKRRRRSSTMVNKPLSNNFEKKSAIL